MLKKLFYYILPGLLLSASWLHDYTFFFIFIAFVPIIQKANTEQKAFKFWVYTYVNMLLWNTGSTWWVCLASVEGGIAAIVANSLLMTLPLLLYYYTQKRIQKPWSIFSLIFYWLTFEYMHLRWELTWPWLSLGNAFAGVPSWVQWYEYTGHLGGSIWVLLINIFIWKYYTNQSTKKALIRLITVASIIVIPLLISILLDSNINNKIQKKYHTIIVQPNIDPYNEKFGELSASEQLDKMLALAATKIKPETKLVMFPETALTDNIEDNKIEVNENILKLRKFIDSFPQTSILIGGNVYHVYQNGEVPQPTARKYPGGMMYDIYNTAIYLEKNKKTELYYKSKLVPGVEKMPYPQVFKFLEKYAIDEGGISGSLGVQEEREVFNVQDKFKIAPVVCYESVFGEYVTEYIKKGANVLCIITNDGWWGNTPGYRQHFNYARLRAIETRRTILRSANTGISGVIDEKGVSSKETKWWEPAVIEATFTPSSNITFYVKHGDYLALLCCWGSLIWLVFMIFKIKF